MSARRIPALVGVLALALAGCDRDPPAKAPGDRDPAGAQASPEEALEAVEPRRWSNQTDYPLTLHGRGFIEGLRLILPGVPEPLPTHRLGPGRLRAVAPEGIELPEHRAVNDLEARLIRPDGSPFGQPVPITIVHDTTYITPYALERDEESGHLYVASPTTDELLVYRDPAQAPSSVPVCDGPRALARWDGPEGAGRWLAVLCALDGQLWLLPLEADEPLEGARKIEVGRHGEQILIDPARHRALISNRQREDLAIVDLVAGEVTGRRPTGGVDPRAMALLEEGVAVAHVGSSDLARLQLDEQAPPARTIPTRETEIVGGHTAPLRQWVMGGKALRDLAYSRRHGVLLGAGIGPNLGPNPERQEVSMNGGVSVIDPDTGRFVRHVSMRRGVPERVALDERRGLLHVADIGMGRVVTFEVAALADPDRAAEALVGAVEIMPPEGTPWLRRRSELGGPSRASGSLHSGTRDLVIDEQTGTVWALNRFTGVITELERGEGEPLRIARQWAGPELTSQVQRRMGEVTYYTDLSHSRMSCDACHYEGHNEGVLFTKGEPMHIYRVTSLHAIAESPPYFTPAMLPSLASTSKLVLGRNRYHDPDPSGREVRALTLFQETIVAPPNPYLAQSSREQWPDTIELPGGGRGDPAMGAALFEGAGQCAECHPPPHFTTDQDPATRGKRWDVGTPVTLPLRLEHQDSEPYPLPAPTLTGIWDRFPLLHSGAAGFSVVEDRVEATHLEALARVLEMAAASGEHGGAHTLDAQQRRDLLAYLLTL